jgi:hypothetical protein
MVVLSLCLKLGLVWHPDKSALIPTRKFQCIGVVFDTIVGIIAVPQERVQAIVKLGHKLLNHQTVYAQDLLVFLGLTASAEKQTHLGRLHMRNIQQDLYRAWNRLEDRFTTRITLSQEAKLDVQWWLSSKNTQRGVPLGRFQPDTQLFTDSSLFRWGAHLLTGESVTRRWEPQELPQSINGLELRAVLKGVYHFKEDLAHKNVLIVTDNMSAVYYINKQGGTRNTNLLKITLELYHLTESLGMVIKARHIPGRLNVLADGLSRREQILPTEWSLNPKVVQRIWEVWHQPQVDLFATRFNHKLPSYVSPCPDPQAWKIDAMSISWQGLDGYAYPPTGMIREVLEKIRQDQCHVILIAPCWPSMSWYPLLLDLLIDHPLELPSTGKLLKQPHNHMFHPREERLCLHAWRLSGHHSETEDFQSKCRVGWLRPQRDCLL